MRFIEMFCGIGGFRLGLERASKEFECVWANDIDKHACKIYRGHFGDKELYEGDIRTVDVATIPEHELLTAGFPCQSFSLAGKRRGFGDTRGTLFYEICRVIRAKRPVFLLLENVPGLLSHDGGATFQTIIGTLDELGYDCQWQVLNSFFLNASNRPRVFIFAIFRDNPNYGWQGNQKAIPFFVSCGTGVGYEDDKQQENMRNAERIIRTFARLPDWLDTWDTLYMEEKDCG